MIRNEREGGLRMIQIRTFIKALKVTWFRRLLINPKISSGVVYQILNLQNFFPFEMGMHYTLLKSYEPHSGWTDYIAGKSLLIAKKQNPCRIFHIPQFGLIQSYKQAKTYFTKIGTIKE